MWSNTFFRVWCITVRLLDVTRPWREIRSNKNHRHRYISTFHTNFGHSRHEMSRLLIRVLKKNKGPCIERVIKYYDIENNFYICLSSRYKAGDMNTLLARQRTIEINVLNKLSSCQLENRNRVKKSRKKLSLFGGKIFALLEGTKRRRKKTKSFWWYNIRAFRRDRTKAKKN